MILSKESEEKLNSVKIWTTKNLNSVRISRGRAKTEQQRIMLAGKVKAYTDVLSYLSDKFGIK